MKRSWEVRKGEKPPAYIEISENEFIYYSNWGATGKENLLSHPSDSLTLGTKRETSKGLRWNVSGDHRYGAIEMEKRMEEETYKITQIPKPQSSSDTLIYGIQKEN